MSIYTALFAGVNGINSNGDAVSIIGDNIANVNTHGFKSNRPEFEDMIAGTSSATGLGSRLQGTTTMHSQGGFEATSLVTDLAIDGSGFFSVYDIPDDTVYYSRAGQFHVDKDGYIVNINGQRLQGFPVDDQQNIGTVVTDLTLPLVPSEPNDTNTVSMQANLDANESILANFDPDNAVATSNFAVGVTVYDSLGVDHLATMYFRKDAANSWQWFTVVASSELDNAPASDNAVVAAGTITFDVNGRQTAFTTSGDIDTTFATLAGYVQTGGNDDGTIDFAGAQANQSITFDFGSTTGAGGSGIDGITQFGANSTLIGLTQDGYKSGYISSVTISSQGIITGNNTNGTTRTLGQITLTLFPNNQGLRRVGGNAYATTLESGLPLSDAAESGGRGGILSSNLEQSNVDLAAELIKMVIIQRGFQANSRTISVVNEMMGSLVTLGS